MNQITRIVYQCGMCKKEYKPKLEASKCEKDCKKKAKSKPKLYFVVTELRKLLKLSNKIDGIEVDYNDEIENLVEDLELEEYIDTKNIKHKLDDLLKELMDLTKLNITQLTYACLLKEQMAKLKDAI